MTDRDRLIELIDDCIDASDIKEWYSDEIDEGLVDYLIANGVTVDDANNATTTWRPVNKPPKEVE